MKICYNRGQNKSVKGLNEMNILVTAGGTKEAIDDVRAITNQSTGELGVLIAKNFLNMGANVVLMAPHEVQQKIDDYRQLTRCEIYDTMSVESALQSLLTNETFDAVIHAMAVSDYRVQSVQDVAGNVLEDQKLSSDYETLTIHLERTPKIIQQIKEWQPNTFLVGFKLLSGATQEELMDAAVKQEEVAHSDLVLANDMKHIGDNQHVAYCIQGDKIIATYHTKQDIAFGLMTEVLTAVSQNEA